MTLTFDVTHYGAKANAIEKDTTSIQKAIDEAGLYRGRVYFPPGNYLSGTLHLRSNILLELSAGATLIGSLDENDFDPRETLEFDSHADQETSCFRHSLIFGENLTNVSVAGSGKIDARGARRGGPKIIALRNCRQISIRGISLCGAANYNLSFLGCERIDIQYITILNGFVDGIDLDCCRYVTIANCYVETRNDAICLKASMALGHKQSTEKVTISNCILTTTRNGFKLGTESVGDFRNIILNDCLILHRPEIFEEKPAAGIALMSVDGGVMESIFVSNVVMEDVRVPIFIRLGHRGRGGEGSIGALKDVSISNIIATRAEIAALIAGIPDGRVGRISINNLFVSLLGDGRAVDRSREVGEEIATDPSASMFGRLPAHGLFCRHVENLRLSQIELTLEDDDARPALIVEDATGLDLICFRPSGGLGQESTVWLRDVRGGSLSGSRAGPSTGVFLRLSGAATENIRIQANDFRDAEVAFQIDRDIRIGALVQEGNLLSQPPKTND